MTSQRRVVGAVLAVFVVSCLTLRWVASETPPKAEAFVSAEETATASESETSGERHEVHIHRPSAPLAIDVALQDGTNRTATVACATCHELREPDPTRRVASDLEHFHRDLPFEHGGLTCVSCHERPSYASFRLADGTSVPPEDVMDLCRQCHGTQARAYDHGAHGGMSGYWDLSRGPRVRNNCIDCHDPHAPAFPRMRPTFKPKDRRPVASERHPRSHD